MISGATACPSTDALAIPAIFRLHFHWVFGGACLEDEPCASVASRILVRRGGEIEMRCPSMVIWFALRNPRPTSCNTSIRKLLGQRLGVVRPGSHPCPANRRHHDHGRDDFGSGGNDLAVGRAQPGRGIGERRA